MIVGFRLEVFFGLGDPKVSERDKEEMKKVEGVMGKRRKGKG